jgi:hypothetical protein
MTFSGSHDRRSDPGCPIVGPLEAFVFRARPEIDLLTMRAELTVVSQNESLLRLVREFAEGLGWTLGSAAPSAISLLQPEPEETRGPDHLLNLLTYVALNAVKTGAGSSEPLCRIRYREGHAWEVTLGIRITEFNLSE